MKKLAIGLMSGTSLDGIDCVLATIEGTGVDTSVVQLCANTFPYEPQLLQKIESCMNPTMCTAELISSVHFELAMAYSDAVHTLCAECNVKVEDVDFISSHGQTIYHINQTTNRYHQSSLQLGDGSVLANLCGTTVVSNFRNADIAQGGCGAPLVPYADFVLFREEHKTVALHNIGGIANVTVLPKNGPIDSVFAFDTGPGNMMIDEAMNYLFDTRFDDGGQVARSGQCDDTLLHKLLNHEFLDMVPPKSTGREQFGIDFTTELITEFKLLQPEDIICTFTHFAAQSMAQAYRQFVLPQNHVDQIVVSGGGTKNAFLLELFQHELPDIDIVTSDEVGMDSDYKEALAFIVLGNETLHHNPSNVMGATGAKKPTILGQVSYIK